MCVGRASLGFTTRDKGIKYKAENWRREWHQVVLRAIREEDEKEAQMVVKTEVERK